MKAKRAFKSANVPAPSDNVREALEFFLQKAVLKNAEIDFELGAGAGVFAIRYARENPARNLISVEKTSEKFSKFESRLKNHEPLGNLLPMQANGISVLTHCCEEASINRFFLWYPNPEPTKARFLRTPFFEFLLSRISQNGEFYFATNTADYFLEMKDFFEAHDLWQLTTAEIFDLHSRPEFKPRTLFEKKYFLRGEKLYELKAIRKAIQF